MGRCCLEGLVDAAVLSGLKPGVNSKVLGGPSLGGLVLSATVTATPGMRSLGMSTGVLRFGWGEAVLLRLRTEWESYWWRRWCWLGEA
ncbi:hypothetical protein GE061_013241 [Apolygus lucorum]|uniref:Uncharacterized protein n=1 Tax=Apolygus lucorum TaxID=248454 RepID=A0A8S9XYM5_APOLU|nr:hypothetical protein GE061_013241 [Apolygus lucorum]